MESINTFTYFYSNPYLFTLNKNYNRIDILLCHIVDVFYKKFFIVILIIDLIYILSTIKNGLQFSYVSLLLSIAYSVALIFGILYSFYQYKKDKTFISDSLQKSSKIEKAYYNTNGDAEFYYVHVKYEHDGKEYSKKINLGLHLISYKAGDSLSVFIGNKFPEIISIKERDLSKVNLLKNVFLLLIFFVRFYLLI